MSDKGDVTSAWLDVQSDDSMSEKGCPWTSMTSGNAAPQMSILKARGIRF